MLDAVRGPIGLEVAPLDSRPARVWTNGSWPRISLLVSWHRLAQIWKVSPTARGQGLVIGSQISKWARASIRSSFASMSSDSSPSRALTASTRSTRHSWRGALGHRRRRAYPPCRRASRGSPPAPRSFPQCYALETSATAPPYALAEVLALLCLHSPSWSAPARSCHPMCPSPRGHRARKRGSLVAPDTTHTAFAAPLSNATGKKRPVAMLQAASCANRGGRDRSDYLSRSLDTLGRYLKGTPMSPTTWL